jgi:hypothetical protein
MNGNNNASNNAVNNSGKAAENTQAGGGMMRVGSKAQVYHGTAHHTKGGLTRKDLLRNKRGKIVSRKQAAAGKKAFSRLRKLGFAPKKGHFKLFTRKR